MRAEQNRIIAQLGVHPTIDPAAEITARVDFLHNYLLATGAQSLVLGISGGQDSSLGGRLCQLAVEKLRSAGHEARFIAVRLPYRIQKDEDDAQMALGFIAADEVLSYNIQAAVAGFESEYRRATGADMSDFNKGNVKARARMVAQYAVAGERRGLVVGTDHAAEAVTGFFTKFGDGAADLTPLAGLNKRQGRALLIKLGAPERLYLKVPTADLLDNAPLQTDEDNLGLRYDDIDDFLEGKVIDPAVAEKIEAGFRATAHKRTVPVAPHDTWWQE